MGLIPDHPEPFFGGFVHLSTDLEKKKSWCRLETPDDATFVGVTNGSGLPPLFWEENQRCPKCQIKLSLLCGYIWDWLNRSEMHVFQGEFVEKAYVYDLWHKSIPVLLKTIKENDEDLFGLLVEKFRRDKSYVENEIRKLEDG